MRKTICSFDRSVPDLDINCPITTFVVHYLAPIENCWQPPKQILRQVPHWDDRTTKGYIIVDGWEEYVTQKFINKRVCSMPARLQAVIEKSSMNAYNLGGGKAAISIWLVCRVGFSETRVTTSPLWN